MLSNCEHLSLTTYEELGGLLGTITKLSFLGKLDRVMHPFYFAV